MFPFFIKSLKAPTGRAPGQSIKAGKPPSSRDTDKADKEGPEPKLGNFSHLLALLADRRPGGDFGPHNVEAGHHVAFAAGAFVGAGKVAATGRDGVTVEDEERREHRVHWREVTGHFAPDKSGAGGGGKAKPTSKKNNA